MKKIIYLMLVLAGSVFAGCEDTSEEIEVIEIELSTDGAEKDDDPATGG